MVNKSNEEEDVAARNLTRIYWPATTLQAVAIIELAGKIDVDREAEEESDWESVEEGEKFFQEESLLQEEVFLLGIEMLRKLHKGDTD